MKAEILKQAYEQTEFEANNGSDNHSWPDIVPFGIGSIAQPDYPIDALGSTAATTAKKIMEVVECPKAMAAASVFGAINTCCQSHWDLEIDGRIQPISIHQVVVGESGIRKSGADNQSHKYIKEEQLKRRDQYKVDYAKYLNELDAYNAERRLILNNRKIKSQQDRQSALDNLKKPDQPINTIWLISDPTIAGIEKSWQNAGYPATALNTTEGGRLLGGHAMKEENVIHTAASFSLYYDGEAVDRIRGADGADVIYGKRLSINIMLQPRLAKKLYANEELRDQGWLSRVAPALCEGKQKDYKEVDLSKDKAMTPFWGRCKELLDKPLPIQDGKGNNLEPKRIKHNAEAKRLYIAFHNHIQRIIQPGEILHSVRGLGEKAHDMASRFAANKEGFENLEATAISLESMKNGIRIMVFHLIEALRLGENTPGAGIEREAYKLWQWLNKRARKNGNCITIRDICQYAHPEFRSSEKIRAIMQRLQDVHRLVRLYLQEPEQWQIRLLSKDEEKLLSGKTKIDPESIFPVDSYVATCSSDVATEEAQPVEIVASVANVALYPGSEKSTTKTI